MPEIKGTAVKSIEGVRVTADGNHMLLTMQRTDDVEFTVAIPMTHVPGLMMLCSQSIGRAAEFAGKDAGTKEALTVESWEMNQDQSNHLVLSLTLAGGGEVSFRLPADSKQRIAELADRVAPKRTHQEIGGVHIERPGSKPH